MATKKDGEHESPDFDRHCAACGQIHGPVNAWIACLTACVVRLKREAARPVNYGGARDE